MLRKRLDSEKLKKLTVLAISNRAILSVFILLTLGILIGAMTSRPSADDVNAIETIAGGFISVRSQTNFISILIKSFGSLFLFIFAAFWLGNNNFGCFIIPFIPLIRGLGLGASLGYFYAFYGAMGLAYCAVLVIPSAIISTISILFASREGMRFSYIMFKRLGRRARLERMTVPFINYCKKFIIYIILIFSASLLDALLNIIFARLFSFA